MKTKQDGRSGQYIRDDNGKVVKGALTYRKGTQADFISEMLILGNTIENITNELIKYFGFKAADYKKYYRRVYGHIKHIEAKNMNMETPMFKIQKNVKTRVIKITPVKKYVREYVKNEMPNCVIAF